MFKRGQKRVWFLSFPIQAPELLRAAGQRCGLLTPHRLIAESVPDDDKECGPGFQAGHPPRPQRPGHM